MCYKAIIRTKNVTAFWLSHLTYMHIKLLRFERDHLDSFIKFGIYTLLIFIEEKTAGAVANDIGIFILLDVHV